MSGTVHPAPMADGRGAARFWPITLGGLRFDWMMAATGSFFLAGAYLDGWAHNHGKVDESFFTPWHGVFYSGYGLVALVLLAAMILNRSQGIPWRQTVPAGYGLSALGLFVFALGGIGDMVWHTLFGIEQGIEALFSPTHLLLGVGMFLILAGPFRAAWRRHGVQPRWGDLLPAIFSLTAVVSLLTFFMMASHPLVSAYGGKRHWDTLTDMGQLAGLVSILITTGILMGPILLALTRWTLPVGAITLVVAINTLAMAIVDAHHGYAVLVAAALVIGVIPADLLARGVRAGPGRPPSLRIVACVTPTFYFLAYFMAMMAGEGVGWKIHLWAGSVVLAGLVGLLLAILVTPPAHPNLQRGDGL